MQGRKARLIGNLAFALVLLTVFFSLYSHYILKKAWGWNIVQGESMVPTLKRGDLVFIIPFLPGRPPDPHIGEIIVFTREGPKGVEEKVIHRVVDKKGHVYLTKGDGNSFTDHTPVTSDKIEGYIIQIGEGALKIPGVGALVLYISSSKARAPLALAILFIILLWWAFSSKSRGRFKRRNALGRFYERHPTFVNCVGVMLLCTLIMVSGAIRGSSVKEVTYGISLTGREQILAGHGEINFDYVRIGSEKESTLTVSTDSIFPMVVLFIFDSEHLSLSQNPVVVQPKTEMEITATINARKATPGLYSEKISMWVLPGFLPPDMIYSLAKIHPLLAALTVSLILSSGAILPLAFLDSQFNRRSKRKGSPARNRGW